MHQGAGAQMQELYPEGFVYLNALYALTWTELLAHLPTTSALRQEAAAETQWAIQEIQSPAATSIFEEELSLPRGAFYQGWSAYALGRYLAALPPQQRDSAQAEHFQRQCSTIAQALATSSSPYLESYSGAAWPADGVMCVAALAWHDRLYAPRYQALIQRWVRAVDTHLDGHRLIPHAVHAGSGRVLTPARGSSQSQLLNFLVEIDSAYARQHFLRYRARFLTSRLGLPGIREATEGEPDAEDIDSGPVIWGVGGAASIVGRRTMQRYHDTTTAVGLRNSIEAFGAPWQSCGEKRYLFGQLPIADAFIAWSNSLEATRPIGAVAGWRTIFQLVSAAVVAGTVWLLWLTRPKNKKAAEH
ncbi:hypothetical protein LF252_12300 [Hymenobacter sp. BT728]|nr:hypothetical protein [Hymenobacter pini]